LNQNINTPASIITGTLLAAGIAIVSFVIFTPATAIISCVLGWTMLTIAIIDGHYLIIPDLLSLPAIPAGLIAVWFMTSTPDPSMAILEHLAAAIAAAGAFYIIRQAYRLVRNREGLGLGDVKLVAVAGAWTGLQGTTYVILLACFGAFSFITIKYLLGRTEIAGTTALPFGSFLSPAIWLVWAIGELGFLPGMA
jgi:leader peptidase (prepilin peptidase) / N-methyltransferase